MIIPHKESKNSPLMNLSKDFLPSILAVETGFAPAEAFSNPLFMDVLDYRLYQNWPTWWRRLEEKTRLDFGLALEAKKNSRFFDMLWIWSEMAAIPLSLLGVDKPMIVICHNLFQRYRKLIVQTFGLAKEWAGVGYITDDDRVKLITQFNIPEERLFRSIKAPLDQFQPGNSPSDGSIISLGLQKRDYPTLFSALEQVPGAETIIFASSQYGGRSNDYVRSFIPNWVHFIPWVTREQLISHYQQSRFVVLPIMDTTHSSAGSTVALEASSAGKAIIATRTSGTPSFVLDGKTGILVSPNDVEGWREAISLLWNNPDMAHEMGMAGRKFVEEKFNGKEIYKKKVDVIRRAYFEAYG